MKKMSNIMLLIVGMLFFVSCSTKNNPLIVEGNSFNVKSSEKVYIEAVDGAKRYRWKQISGIKIVLKDSNSHFLEFVAPKVEKKEIVKFELKVIFERRVDELSKKEIVTIIIEPLEDVLDSEDNRTIPKVIKGEIDINVTIEIEEQNSTDKNITVVVDEQNITDNNAIEDDLLDLLDEKNTTKEINTTNENISFKLNGDVNIKVLGVR